jgi:ParB family chromosome partitioning protein
MSKIEWQIEKRHIDDLIGYDKNPRKFTDKGLKDLKKSLQNCGDANIITINADNTVLGGHARLTVMKQLGYETVDVKVPTKQLNDKQVQEIVVRLNANTAGEWDLEKLQADFEINELQEWGLDIEFEDPFKEEKENEKDIALKETFEVVCECEDEIEQEALFLRLNEEGVKCRILTL